MTCIVPHSLVSKHYTVQERLSVQLKSRYRNTWGSTIPRNVKHNKRVFSMNVWQYFRFIYRQLTPFRRFLLSFSSACRGVKLSRNQNMQTDILMLRETTALISFNPSCCRFFFFFFVSETLELCRARVPFYLWQTSPAGNSKHVNIRSPSCRGKHRKDTKQYFVVLKSLSALRFDEAQELSPHFTLEDEYG